MFSDKFKLGLFIILFFVVICALFIIFGIFDFGSEKVNLTTFFQESVQGLETGSIVKLRGVPIGKVSDITINMHNRRIRVDMVIDLEKVRIQAPFPDKNVHTPASQGKIDNVIQMILFSDREVEEKEFYKIITNEIRSGLRARLELSGITGGKYVELDYVGSTPLPETAFGYMAKADTCFIPSQPSMMMGLRTSGMEIMAKIASIDYKGISEKLESVLKNLDAIVKDPEIGKAIRNIEEVTARTGKMIDSANVTIQNVNAVLTQERIRQLTDETDAMLLQMRKLAGTLEQIVEKAKIAETTGSFREATGNISAGREDLRKTLASLNETLAALEELLKTLDDDPSSLLRGKKK